jgi:chorismate mutase/prephenate dehydratase
MAKDPNVRLDEVRADIDVVDDQILALLNRRAALVGDAADLKTGLALPFYNPTRERQVTERLSSANRGPFPTEAIRAVYREIFSACLSLEKRVRVAYLGPEGTFSHMAVLQQFGQAARAIPIGTIPGVFDEVTRGDADFGVVPIENTTEGGITHTSDTFLESDLKISAEIALEVHMCLLAKPGLELANIERVYSIPVAAAQCRKWLATNLPRATLIESRSTVDGAQRAQDDPHGAAVAGEIAARLADLVVLRRNIEDSAHNMTRFLVIGPNEPTAPTGRDKTSLLLVTRDEPGILYRTLGAFAERGLNMSKIESRPSRRKAWEYVFFVDIDGHEHDAKVADALVEVRKSCQLLKVLGSYPRGEGPSGRRLTHQYDAVND